MSGKYLKGLRVLPFLLGAGILMIFWRFDIDNYYLCSVLLILDTLLPFFLRIERKGLSARELATLAVLCALAVISRVAFLVLPGFKPLIGIVMITGMAFGTEAGSFVGAMSAFVSNFVFGQGPWTPWQMLAFGLAGFLAGILRKQGLLDPDKPVLNAVTGANVVLLVVGPLLDTCAVFTMMTTYTAQSVGAVYLAGIPANLVHALATALTLGLFSRPMSKMLDRIRIKYGIMQKNQKKL